MILEFFWPRKLKEIITKYKKMGVLNQEAIEHIYKLTYKYLWITFALSLLFTFTAKPIVGITFFCFFSLLISLDFDRIFYTRISPYIEGKKVEVLVTNTGIDIGGVQHIWCKVIDSDLKLKITIGDRPKIPSEIFPKKGGKLFVYHSYISKNRAMPDLDILKNKYSLQTNLE